jgi:hypothetical protein
MVLARTFSIASEGVESRSDMRKALKYSSSNEPLLQTAQAGTVIGLSGSGLSKNSLAGMCSTVVAGGVVQMTQISEHLFFRLGRPFMASTLRHW